MWFYNDGVFGIIQISLHFICLLLTLLPKSGKENPSWSRKIALGQSHIIVQWKHHQWPSNQSKLNWYLLLSKFGECSFYWYWVFSQSHMLLQWWQHQCPSSWSDFNWCVFLILKSKFIDYRPCCKWVIALGQIHIALQWWHLLFSLPAIQIWWTPFHWRGNIFFKYHIVSQYLLMLSAFLKLMWP